MVDSRRVPSEPLAMGSTGPEVRKLYEYLKRFGYFPNEELARQVSFAPAVKAEPADVESFDEVVEQGVRLFQQQNGLVADGQVGPKTLALMNMPRCGVADRVTDGPARFVASGSRWDHLTISYHFDNNTTDLPAADAQAAVRGAFDRWAAVSPLRFVEVNGASDIQIGWFAGDHGDGANNAFDGASGVLAHCYYPPPAGGNLAGDLHFDEAENWTVNTPPTGIDLPTVALHEIGHGIGLDHSADPNSVMFAFYGGMRRELTHDDIAGVQAIYGGWHQPFPIAPPNSAVPGAIATLSRNPNHADVYWIGPDGGVGTNFWTLEEGWHQPFPIAPPNEAAPGAIATLSRNPDHADVYWIAPDGSVRTNFWTAAEGWHQPFAIAPPGHAVPGAIATLSRNPNHADVYWIGPDGGVGTNFWTAEEGWHTPFPIAPSGHAARGAIATLSRNPNHADVYWVGPDGGVGTNFWTLEEGWHNPFPIAPPGHAVPGAIATLSRNPNHADAYWVGPDGGVGTNFWTVEEGWHTPFPIAPSGHAVRGAIATLSRNPDHADVYWIGPDGGIGTNFWTKP